jgi:hypothetical protein
VMRRFTPCDPALATDTERRSQAECPLFYSPRRRRTVRRLVEGVESRDFLFQPRDPAATGWAESSSRNTAHRGFDATGRVWALLSSSGNHFDAGNVLNNTPRTAFHVSLILKPLEDLPWHWVANDSCVGRRRLALFVSQRRPLLISGTRRPPHRS